MTKERGGSLIFLASGDEVQSLNGEELAKYMNEESAKIAKLYVEMVKELPK
jgi:hypothetical protein